MPTSAIRTSALCLSMAALAAQDWYVAPGAAATNDGRSLAAPFPTIQKAATAAMAGDTVQIRAGTYRETVIPARSGTTSAPITFQAYNNEVVTINGAEPITGWSLHTGNIWKAPMAAAFFNRATPGSGTNLYDAAVHNQADQVFVDGAMMLVARWPNTPSLNPSRPVKASTTAFVSKSRASNWTTGVVDDTANTLPASACVGAEIFFQPSDSGWSWVFTGQVTAKSGARLTFRSRSDSGQDFSQGVYHPRSRYYLFNTLALLDSAGEWYHDKIAGQLYLWAPGGGNPQGKVEAKKREFAFDLSGRSYVTVKGLRLHACTITTDNISGGDNVPYDSAGANRYPWRNAAYGRSTTPYHNPPYNDAASVGCVLDGLDVRYPTHYTDVSGMFSNQWGQSSGIVLSGSRHILRNSAIRLSAGNGVSVIGRECRVLNNLIEDVNYNANDCGFIHTGVTDRCSSDHEIAWNTCRRAGKSGIMPRNLYSSNPTDAGNTWKARIHHNDVSGFAIQDGDSGALYTASNGRFVRIDHNVFRDANVNIDDRANFGNYTVGGVYLDYSRNFIVDHNVIWGVEWGVHLQNQEGDQANHLVYNNTIAVQGLSNPEPGYGPFGVVNNSGANQSGTVVRNNIIHCTDGAIGFRHIDFTNVSPRIVQDNLLWNNVAGSTTDPRFVGGAWPAGARLTSASAKAIDLGQLFPTYSRDGLSVPGFNDAVIGTRPDLGAYEYGATAWTAGSSLAGTTATTTTTTAGTGSILREYWTGIAGTAVTDLTSNANYPGAPTGSTFPTSFEAPTSFGDNYGTRMRGYLQPTVSGAYTFWIAGDDNCELWLSTTSDAGARVRIAKVSSWTNSQAWDTVAEQKSAAITLVAGQRYYIEALQKEGGGGDNLAVAWQPPGGARAVIPGANLAPFQPVAVGKIGNPGWPEVFVYRVSGR